MIVIGADHAGFELKEYIKNYLDSKKILYFDVSGNTKNDNDDYPDIAKLICKKVLENSENVGIAICGTGIGISISCNKIKNIRAALCTSNQMAEFARRHNNANVICFGARLENIDSVSIEKMLDTFLNTSFEGGRHQRRLDKIERLESDN